MQGLIHLLGRPGIHMWLIVRQLPIKAGWWDAALALRHLAKTICTILTMGVSPFCSNGVSLAVKFLPQLPKDPTLFPSEPSPKITTQTQQFNNKNPLHCLHTSISLFPLGRYPASTSHQNLPFFFSWHTPIQPIMTAPRTQQWQQ